MFDNPTPQNTEDAPAPVTTPEVVDNQPQTTPVVDVYADQLAQIKSDDGRQKYADVATALQSIPHAQAKIKELTDEIQNLKQELEKRKGVEAMLAELQSPAAEPSLPASQGEGVDIAAAVRAEMAALEATRVREANKQKVEQALLSQYGEKAPEVFTNRAAELGVTVEYLTEQALQFPDFVLAQFKSGGQSPTNPVPVGRTVPSTAQPEIKPVMRGASTKDVIAQYRLHAKSN